MALGLRRRLLPLITTLLLVVGTSTPRETRGADLSAHAAALKQMEVRFMMRGAQREATRHRARRRAAARARAGERPGRAEAAPAPVVGLARRPAPVEPPDPPHLRPPRSKAPRAASAAAVVADRIVNNRAGDSPFSGQAEVSVAAHGQDLVAAWNDGEGFETGSSTQGFAFSTDGGTTWVDGGIPPTTGGVGVWSSDPLIAVNERTGAFYYSALCEPTQYTNGIGVVKGTFRAGQLVWETPRVAIAGNNSSVIYDKEWLAVDSLTGRLYLTYSRFNVLRDVIISNRIEFSRNTSDNQLPWSTPVQLSAPRDVGRVQGPRVVAGPAGEVWATWVAIGTIDQDYVRLRRGFGGGTYWGGEVTPAAIYNNFGSGAPGFNRGVGFSFPGIAVDRSNGPRRGRVYLTWNESVNFYDDALGEGPTVTESEANDTPGTASSFSMGNTLVGAISDINDLDYWSFAGSQGQTIICELDSLYTTNLDASFRLFCSDGATRLAFSETGAGGFDNASGLIVFTLPADGTYFLRVASVTPDGFTPPGTGGYRIHTGLNGSISERGRDHRDVFTTYSDDGLTWATPERVNREAPLYDDWLPEVAVAPDGNVFASWYDWRDAPPTQCGGASMTYLARSLDHAASWPDGFPISTAASDWTDVLSDIAPNQGDYMALFADRNALYACWSDGRNGDPDVFMTRVALAARPALNDTYARPDLVRVRWILAPGTVISATVYRRADAAAWTPLGAISPDGSGILAFEDHAVTVGTRYHYRLGLTDDAGESFTDEVTIDVPLTAEPGLAIQGVRPNPTPREIWVTFSLPSAEPATLEVLDATGRRVGSRPVAGAGLQSLEIASGLRLPAGVYLVRIVQGDRSAAARVSVVR